MTNLPIESSISALRAALADHGHAVLVAPPGSGKTTIVPIRLLAEPWLEGRRIVMLEPRRLATRAAARRMAFLLSDEVGGTVGYVTRDERRVGPRTRIEVVTEGVLTRRLQRDPDLPGTGFVIFDEFHERNLQTDLGLALALDSRRHFRPDLRLLAMSATIKADRVAALLGRPEEAAPVIVGEASSHPVELRWAPALNRVRLEPHAAAVVRRALREETGDVLVFLPGMAEIRRVAEALADIDADLRPLHGSLSVEDQDLALAPGDRRKVVLSTDIAESSLTVEGVRVVIDSGLARAPRFDARTGMTRLRTVPISRESAEQRAGRAGRTGPGAVYRLWSKLEHGARRPQTDPEITQVDLAGLALELASWGVDDPGALAFLDPPPGRSFSEGRSLLTRLGALDHEGRLTALGRGMAELPLHPRLGRMVVEAGTDGYLACVLAALVDDRDILRGHLDELPVDLGMRVRLLTGESHPQADRRGLERVKRNAADLARRAGIRVGAVDSDRAGRMLALAFPDRLALRRGSPGRFQLRTGTTAWMPATDPLAPTAYLVVADLDGKRRDARIRLAAALEPDDIDVTGEVEETTKLVWVGDRLVERRERRLGGIVLDEREHRPAAGPAVRAALITRLRSTRLEDLAWTPTARQLVDRVMFLRSELGPPWPDWSISGLTERLEDWLPVGDATGLDDLRRVDIAPTLRRQLGRLAGEVDRLAPTHLTLATGRRVAIGYSGEAPVLAVKVQEMFGVTTTPTVAGVPVILHLLSPAGRPLQITSDLAGFWTGSWQQVRKEMAGRYPKHRWPENPGGEPDPDRR